MKSIGITGGIGTGKSIVCHLLQILGFPVYDSDTEAKKLINIHPVIRKKLINIFGSDIYIGQELNKALLSKYIFSNSLLLNKVNAIVHPVVQQHYKDWCLRQKASFVFLESAILFESGFESCVDEVWVVTAPEKLRICRVMKRNNCSEKEVKQRISAQLDEIEKCKRADFVITNDDRIALIPQILKYLNEK